MDLCEILKVPVFVGRVFFTVIRILDLQNSMCCITQKEINRLYGSRNALWDTELIIDNVHFLADKPLEFKDWIRLTGSPINKKYKYDLWSPT